jgi:hypothetical protein
MSKTNTISTQQSLLSTGCVKTTWEKATVMQADYRQPPTIYRVWRNHQVPSRTSIYHVRVHNQSTIQDIDILFRVNGSL